MKAPITESSLGDPGLSAAEIGRRFLKLIEGAQSRSDLTIERIREVIGISLVVERGALATGVRGPELEGGWRYIFNYVPASGSLLQGVSLSFENQGTDKADMAPVCELDFDHFHQALKKMGFRDVPVPGEIGQLESWRYYKGDITLSITPQNVIPGEAGTLCVESIGTLN